MSFWDSLGDKLGETGSNLLDTVSGGAVQYLDARIQDKVRGGQQVNTRSETIISEESPLPYDGPQKEAQAYAAAMQEKTSKYVMYGGALLGVVALIALARAR